MSAEQAAVACTALVCGLLATLIVTAPSERARTAAPRTVSVVATVEPQGTAPVGSMTAREFDSVRVGSSGAWLDDMFGRPPDNVDGDHRQFYDAAEGGTYWFYFDDRGDRDKVTGKEYRRR